MDRGCSSAQRSTIPNPDPSHVTPLVAYAADKYSPGIESPGFSGHTYDWRDEPNTPNNTARVQDGYTVAPLTEACARVYKTGAHLVPYIVFRDGAPLAHQPRVNKGGYAWLLEQGYEVRLNTLLVDIDNPGHQEHGPLAVELWTRRLREELPGFGFYVTSGGVRLVVALAEWTQPETAEEMLETLLCDLEAKGFKPDRKCRDWTRHYRLPHVYREDKRIHYRSPAVEVDNLVPQTIAPTPIVRRRSARGPKQHLAPFALRAPIGWASRIERLAELLRGRYQGDRHAVSLALAGALLSVRVQPEIVPAIVAEATLRAGWNDPRLHESNAAGTVSKWADRQQVTGLPFLQRVARDVADAVEVIGGATAEERARQENDAPPPPTLPCDVALQQMAQEIRNAYGLVVLRAQCGLGKSHTAREVAAERATKPSKPDAKRAPNGSRTGFSVPNHELALQHSERLRADGVPVRRVFGVLSMKDPDGKPICRYANTASLVAGGQSIPRVFCEGNGRAPCEYRNECPAYGGIEGPEDARVVVGTHALLSQIDAEVGKSGLLIIDEPPDLLHTESFTLGDIDATIAALGRFSHRYARAMAPALCVIRAWVATTIDIAEIENNFKSAFEGKVPADVAVTALGEVGTDDPWQAATLAFPEDHDPRIGYAPPLDLPHLLATRHDEDVARQVGRASKLLRTVWNACQPNRAYSTRVEEYTNDVETTRVLMVTGARTEIVDALTSKHQHPVVVLDANADLHRPVYQRIVYVHEVQDKPPKDIDAMAPRFRYREFYAADGAPIERAMVMWGASRKAWFPGRQLTVESGAVSAIERAVRWALERPEQATNVCIVTFKLLATAIRAALGQPGAEQEWHKQKQPPETLAPLAERIRKTLKRLPGAVDVAHYGAVRGLDRWMHADCLITLGDPVPELGSLRHDAAFIGLPDADERAHGVTRGELEQAHGRLRTVHRRTPARSLHVGRVLPGGWHGAKIMGRSRAEDWARGGEMGKAFGVLGAAHGVKGAQFGVLGAEHGIKGKDFGPLGAAAGTKGAAAGAAIAETRRNQSDMVAGEVQVLVSMIGGNAAATELLGVSVPALMRYKKGDRAIPQDLADRLRERATVRLSGPPLGPVSRENISSLASGEGGGPDNRPANDNEDAAE